MKHALTRFYDFFKMASVKSYSALAGLVLLLQTQLTDPETIAMLSALFSDNPFMVKIIQMLPSIILALFAPHTKEAIDSFTPNKDGL